MKPAILIVIFGLVVAQSAGAQSVSDVWTAHAERQKQCGAEYVAKKIKTATTYMHCAYDGFYDALNAIGAQNMDLINDLVTNEFAIAERIDHKKISLAEGQAEEAQVMSRIDTEAQTRMQVAAQRVDAANAAAAQQQQEADAQAAHAAQAQAQADLEQRRARYCAAAAMTAGSVFDLSKGAAPLCAKFGYPIPTPAASPEAGPYPPINTPVHTNCQWFGTQWQCTTQ